VSRSKNLNFLGALVTKDAAVARHLTYLEGHPSNTASPHQSSPRYEQIPCQTEYPKKKKYWLAHFNFLFADPLCVPLIASEKNRKKLLCFRKNNFNYDAHRKVTSIHPLDAVARYFWKIIPEHFHFQSAQLYYHRQKIIPSATSYTRVSCLPWLGISQSPACYSESR